MASKPIKISVLADTKDLSAGMSRAENDIKGLGDTASREMGRVDNAVGDAADGVASGSSQAAGAIGDIGGALAATGFISEGMASSMDTAAAAIMGVTGVADIANLVTEKLRLATIGATIAEKSRAAAAKVGAAAQWALNAAMSANPIALVVIAIVALVAAFVIAYKKSETFRNIVNKAFAGVKAAAAAVARFFTTSVPRAFERVKGAASAVLSWVKGNWPKILAVLTGPFGLAVLAIAKNWDRIKSGAASVRDFVTGRFNALVGFFSGLPGRISGIASRMWSAIPSAFRSALNGVIGAWNGLSFTIPSISAFGKTIGGGTIGTPNIPYLAQGGITTGPTLAVVGDNPGGREAIIPLDKYDIGGSRTYNITVVAPVGASSADIGRDLIRHIDAYERAGGRRRA